MLGLRILETFPYQRSIAYSYLSLGIVLTGIPFSVDYRYKG